MIELSLAVTQVLSLITRWVEIYQNRKEYRKEYEEYPVQKYQQLLDKLDKENQKQTLEATYDSDEGWRI